MNEIQSPKALMQALCAHADPRKTRSLRLIYAICEEQRDRGSKDYSVATIGRLSAERGGPAAGAIRNKTGEPYRAVIKAFADSVGSKSRRTVEVRSGPAGLILHGGDRPCVAGADRPAAGGIEIHARPTPRRAPFGEPERRT